jgi:hypothetical protein
VNLALVRLDSKRRVQAADKGKVGS